MMSHTLVKRSAQTDGPREQTAIDTTVMAASTPVRDSRRVASSVKTRLSGKCKDQHCVIDSYTLMSKMFTQKGRC